MVKKKKEKKEVKCLPATGSGQDGSRLRSIKTHLTQCNGNVCAYRDKKTRLAMSAGMFWFPLTTTMRSFCVKVESGDRLRR